MKKPNPIAPLFKDLYWNPKFEILTLQESMVYNIILFYSYHEGPVMIPSSTLKRYAKVSTDGSADKIVKSLKLKGFIETIPGKNNITGRNTREFKLVKRMTPKGFGKPLRKIIHMEIHG